MKATRHTRHRPSSVNESERPVERDSRNRGRQKGNIFGVSLFANVQTGRHAFTFSFFDVPESKADSDSRSLLPFLEASSLSHKQTKREGRRSLASFAFAFQKHAHSFGGRTCASFWVVFWFECVSAGVKGECRNTGSLTDSKQERRIMTASWRMQT